MSRPITAEFLDDLERKARASTPGPWRLADRAAYFGTMENPSRLYTIERNVTHPGPDLYVRQREDETYEVLRLEEPTEDAETAAHIVANSPDVTLLLVAIARATTAWVHASKQAARLRLRWQETADDTMLGHIELLDRTIIAARAEIDRLVLGG